MRFLFFQVLVTLIALNSMARSLSPDLKGQDLLTGNEIQISTSGKKAMVVVFLSANCPCSNSHVKELNDLAKKYSDVAFVGINSNADETKEQAQDYFHKAHLAFPIIRDARSKLADEFKAAKTPHAFLLKPDGQVLYEGGVSSSRLVENADKKLLREALEDLQSGQAIRTPLGRTLGCVISRGEKYVW